MSCPDGSCLEPGKRLRALIMLGLMMLVFIVLSGFSFLKSRDQVTPDKIQYGPHLATDGKRVFQAYNCMDCHTVVGNGAYFAPDLTQEFKQTGPAWLAAFIPSAGAWPTEAAVLTQLQNADVAAEVGVTTIEDYYKKYPGAKERIERRGGKASHMPNIRFRSEEIGQLIAFLKYTSAMNTEGWPPAVKTGSLQERLTLLHGASEAAVPVAAPADAAAESSTPESRGEKLVQTWGCLACHATDRSKVVGPPWGGLYGSQVKLTDGRTVVADDAFLTESILNPNASYVDGFLAGTMPPYAGLIQDEEVKDIVAYIRSLEKN